jgi:hypothetical protein
MIRLLEGIKTDTGLLGYVKQIMYSARIHNVQHLKQPIREAAASVSADVLGRVWQEMQYRFDVCRVTNEALIELYKKKTPWSESASELYRPSDCRLSAK